MAPLCVSVKRGRRKPLSLNFTSSPAEGLGELPSALIATQGMLALLKQAGQMGVGTSAPASGMCTKGQFFDPVLSS